MAKRMGVRIGAAFGLAAALPAAGQEAAPGIPAIETVVVPPISGGRDPKVVAEGWKHFYFYKPDTSYEAAYADFAECYRFLPLFAEGTLPLFVPWNAKPGAHPYERTVSPYGLVGEAIGALLQGSIERRAFQSRMRRCMEPRGYQRFPVSKEVWVKILDGYSPQSIAIQAKIVTMGPPDALPLPVTK